MKASYFVGCLVLISTLVLQGCGFKPRGSYLIDEDLNAVHLSSSDEFSPLTRELKRRLELSNIKVYGDSQAGVPTLHIGGEEISRRTLSLFSNGQVAEYELSYYVNGWLQLSKERKVPIQVQLHRDFQDNPLAALAKQREKELLYDELRDMAADQILRQLAAVQL